MRELLNPMSKQFSEYLRDETRIVGWSEGICFPTSEHEIISVLKYLFDHDIAITVQGARTSLNAAAVPFGGYIVNLSKMNRILGMRRDAQGGFRLRMQPGCTLRAIQRDLTSKNFSSNAWDQQSLDAYAEYKKASPHFFPPDPTETSATIGGMVSCNASGAKGYYYGPTRKWITALRLVLTNGETVAIRRGETLATGRNISFYTEQGRRIDCYLPGYDMPHSKSTAGYYIEDNVDLIDLVIGSDGTLGVISEVEVMLFPVPETIWGVACFFRDEEKVVEFVMRSREQLDRMASLEFFDGNSLNILRRQKEESTAFAKLPYLDQRFAALCSLELHCPDEETALDQLLLLGRLLEQCGGKESDTWVARNESDLQQLVFLRHAVPESVNMMIDHKRKQGLDIIKLNTDMSVPNHHLGQMMTMYKRMLAEFGLEYAIWGHIGENNLHVNIIPRNKAEYDQGKRLFEYWAGEITKMGGAVCSEHGAGKLKAHLLRIMYGDAAVEEMRGLKTAFDPKGLAGVGNIIANTPGDESNENNCMHQTGTL